MSEFNVYTPHMDWETSEEFPEDVGVRILRQEPDGGSRTLMLQLSPGSEIPAHCHRGTVQLFVLEGACERAGRVLPAGAYVLLTGHVDVPLTATKTGATLLLMLDPVAAPSLS